MAETKDCTLGYGSMYNNCMGMKNGSIAPCDKIGNNRMCIYEHKDQAYEAFKKIWTKGYGGGFPTYKMAAVYTGNDRPDNWLRIVTYYYNQ